MIPNASIHAARLPALSLAGILTFCASAAALERDVPYVPTPPPVVEKMLDMTEVKAGEFVIDLGSGDGRIAIAAAQRGATALGVDIDPDLVKEATENAEKAGVGDKASFKEANLFDTDISEAHVITMYLLPSVNLELRPRLLELKPGTRLVSHAFTMGDWQPDEEAEIDGRRVYFWRVPAKVDGAWAFEHDGQTINVTLEQKYQAISGTAAVGGAEQPVEGKVEGEVVRIAFGSGDARREFTGRVNGTALEPVRGEGASGWTARRG